MRSSRVLKWESKRLVQFQWPSSGGLDATTSYGTNVRGSPGPMCLHIDLRSMSLLACTPSSNAVVGAYEVVADQDRIVAIRDAPYHLTVDFRPAIPALVVRAQRFGEACGGERKERRREWPRRPFREQRISGLEVEWRTGLGFGRVRIIRHRRSGAYARLVRLLRIPSQALGGEKLGSKSRGPPRLREEGGSGTAQAERRRDHASGSWKSTRDSAPDLLSRKRMRGVASMSACGP
jgi:hypothetical protein